MTPLLPNATHDTEQLINPASAAVSLHAHPLSGEQSSCLEPEKHQDVGEIPLSDVPQVVIGAIHATGLTLGLRRIPAGFYVEVQADDIQWQTINKPVHIGLDVFEWNQRIVLPSETSSKIRFKVYASYEFCPMLGHGDLLRTLEISVAELLDRSGTSRPVIFQSKAGEVISPCTSLFVKMEQLLFCDTGVNILHPIPSSIPCDIRDLQLFTDAGHCILGRYHRTQDKRDLDQSLAHFERSLDLCPIDHPCRAAALVNVAIAKFTHCQIYATCLDLDIPISLFQDALELRPTGHPDRPTTQLHLSMVFLSRFTKRGFYMDAEATVELLDEVPDECHAKSYIYSSAVAAIEAYNVHRPEDIDADDHRMEELMLSMSVDELVRQLRLCAQTDDPHTLDEVISLHYEALKYDTTHSYRDTLLNNLGCALHIRFERRGSDEDLDEAIMFHREALILRPVGHQDRPSLLNNLAKLLHERFEHRGSNKDLHEAIVLHREALTLCPHSDKDPDEPIMRHREALTLHPVGHPDRPQSLRNLANTLHDRFENRGSDDDLDEAIVLHREALTLCPVGHPQRPLSLDNLANMLDERFHHQGDDNDLDEAIVLHREALTLQPVGHVDRPASLNNLANTLRDRFEQRSSDKDLDEAIMLYREALTLHPVGHLDRPQSLSNLANILNERFEHRGSDEDLDEAMVLHREALTLCSIGHPHRPRALYNLANTLHECFEHRGGDKDLDEAIVLHREALTLHPVGHTDRPSSLNSLADVLYNRFKHRGSDKDLDEAIVLHREALNLYQVGHTDRPLPLNNLANTLHERFEHRGSDKDLDEAIVLHREALTLHPVGHTDRPSSLNNLANALHERFQHRDSDKDLDEAIVLHREALTLHPVGHLDRPRSLNNVASVLGERFEHRGGDKDLDEAIVLHREALNLHPVGHPDLPLSLNNLASALHKCFEHRGIQKDLDDAQANAYSALTLLKAHDPNFARVNGILADIYLSLHSSGLNSTANDTTDDLDAAIRHLKVAAGSVSSGLLNRLHGSIRWVEAADQYAHNTLLEAYTTSIPLLDAYISSTASVSSRHHAMELFPPIFAVNPASIALRNGEVCRAVELLEQGRTLIWTQMARFRTPLDTLKEHNSDTEALVKRFRQLSSALDKYPEPGEGIPRVSEEAEAVRYSRLVDEWNGVVDEIRNVDGFSRFMLPPLFSDLQDSARDGPVIILIASELSCDAIIVVHQRSPVPVRLDTSAEKLQRLANALQSTVERDDPHERETIPEKRKIDHGEKQMKLVGMLRELWVDVVGPVVENLAGLAQPGSRIWWCPTLFFNFLPLHAAGEYRRGGKNLSSLYVSSYTPSLTALIRARRHHHKSQPSLFAAIGQNHPPGSTFTLDFVEPELDSVHNLLPPSPTVCKFTKVTSIESTKSRAFRALQDNHWLHFACHGTQNLDEPFKSALLMRDEPLTLLDITQTDLSKHQYVFLSACDTAVGVPDRPDEVIHLAAALQFAGVKSVIGTFWSVDDISVGRLIKEFYTNFCGDGKMNSKRAARALHKAVQSLANDKNVPLDQRILFMHIGI